MLQRIFRRLIRWYRDLRSRCGAGRDHLDSGLWDKDELGRRGELAAAQFLEQRGMKLIGRNVRLRRLGELDIVADDHGTLVFIEVKTRRTHTKGHPAMHVDLRKQKKLTLLAMAYMKRYRVHDQPVRFDVVAITWPSGQSEPTIDYYPYAFKAIR